MDRNDPLLANVAPEHRARVGLAIERFAEGLARSLKEQHEPCARCGEPFHRHDNEVAGESRCPDDAGER